MKSKDYWAFRSRQDKLKVIRRGEKGVNELKKLLLLNAKDIKKQIEAFYDKYGENPSEQLTLFDTKIYKQKLKKAVKRYPKDRTLKKILRQDAPKYKIDRLREFETQIQMQLSYMTLQQEKGIETTLKDVAKYSNTLMADKYTKGLGITFNLISEKKLNQIINQTWVGRKNWSERVWADRDLVGKKVTNILSKGSVQGTSLQTMARELRDVTGNSFYNAFRLIRTETSHIDAQMELQSMKEALNEGLATKYRYDAFLDDRTSKICSELNGKIFNIEDAEIGVNFWPMHPNCRSTSYIVLDEE